jgi:radical SAM superfamily enzyme YgiQ (UPF0313 family)
MVDILLVQPPIRDFYLTAKRTIPYGLASIAAALRRAGFSVAILDALATRRMKTIAPPPEMTYLAPYYGHPDRSPFSLFHHFRHYGLGYERIACEAAAFSPRLVGISALFTPYAETALATAVAIKRALPDSPIVVGGHHATAFPRQMLACKAIDFVIRGEGEAAMVQLAKALDQRAALDDVPGLARYHDNGDLNITPPAVIKDTTQLPNPALDLIDQHFYRRGKTPSAQIAATRGCPFHCTYCACGSKGWTPYRRRPLQQLIEELDSIIFGAGARFIDFEDENLSLERNWFLRLLRTIESRYGHLNIELRAMNGLYPPTLDEAVIVAMRRAGFKTLNLALGSRDAEQCRRFNRPDVSGAFQQAVRLAHKHHLSVVGYIIVGAPDQPPQTSLGDLLYLASLPLLVGVSVYYPVRPSRDYARCAQLGLLPASFGLRRSAALPIEHRTSRDQAVTLLRLGRMLNFIKSRYHRRPLPKAAAYDQYRHSPVHADRAALGDMLLSWFLHDFQIRGVTTDGRIYHHRTSIELTQPFADAIKAGKIVPAATNYQG